VADTHAEQTRPQITEKEGKRKKNGIVLSCKIYPKPYFETEVPKSMFEFHKR
jgi:hypothetical protein